jgi:drug/metabolite transporter (DMT)-like permease
VAYLGVVQIGLAYVCMTRAVRHVPAFEVSLLLLLEPVASALLAWLIHDEQPGPWSLAGCSVILLATVVRTLRRGG